MTTSVTIQVPEKVTYMVKVIQEDKTPDGWRRNVSAEVFLNPGERYTTHIWDTKRVIIEEVHN